MLCPNCRTEVPDGSFFCAECGADVIPVDDREDADDACRAVPDEAPSPRRGEEPDLSPRKIGGEVRQEEGPEFSGAASWEDALGNPAGATVRLSAENDGRDDFPWAGPEEATGALWKDRVAQDDGTQEYGYSAAPAADDAAAVPPEPAPVPEDDGRIRIREGSQGGPRRRVPMPYDPMEDLMAGSPPEKPSARRNGDAPARQVPFTAVAGLIAAVLLVIAVVLFVAGGAPAGDAVSTAAASGPVPDVTAAPAATPPPVAQMPAFTGSIVLRITPAFDGYEATVTGGSRIGEVERIAITVEDRAGVHTLDWYYPYKGESFVLMRDMYGGVPARVERVRAEAVFDSGERELVWEKEY